MLIFNLLVMNTISNHLIILLPNVKPMLSESDVNLKYFVTLGFSIQ